MSIFQRLKSAEIDPANFVVVGSGILDALNIRSSNDVDVVVDQATFDQLMAQKFEKKTKDGELYLAKDDLEVWLTFDNKNFSNLMGNSTNINGYNFMNLDDLIDWKRRKGRDKDKQDIELVEKFKRELDK